MHQPPTSYLTARGNFGALAAEYIGSMSKMTELVRQGRSHWYVRTAVLALVVLFGLSLSLPSVPIPIPVPGPIPKSVLEARNLEANITRLGNMQASEAWQHRHSLLFGSEDPVILGRRLPP